MNHLQHTLRPTLVVAAAALLLPLTLEAQRAGDEEFIGNVTLTFHIIEADGFDTVDPAIADVVEELRKLFRYEGYRLGSTSVLNAGIGPDGFARVSQIVAASTESYQYRISSYVQQIRRDDDIMRVGVELQHASRAMLTDDPNSAPRLIEASVNVREGQTVVLGSAKPTSEGAAIILVMTPSTSTP